MFPLLIISSISAVSAAETINSNSSAVFWTANEVADYQVSL